MKVILTNRFAFPTFPYPSQKVAVTPWLVLTVMPPSCSQLLISSQSPLVEFQHLIGIDSIKPERVKCSVEIKRQQVKFNYCCFDYTDDGFELKHICVFLNINWIRHDHQNWLKKELIRQTLHNLNHKIPITMKCNNQINSFCIILNLSLLH